MTNQRAELDDLRRTAAVAADYTTLQGLINVTTGLGFVLWALDHSSWAAVVMGLGAGAGSLYYRWRFGQAVRHGSVVATLAVVLSAFVICMAGLVLDRLLAGPVLTLPLLAAACLAVAYRLGYRHVGVTRTHWAAVALLVVGSLAPLLGLAVLGASTGMLLLGVAVVLVGVADHVRLVAAMKPVPRD
jgi:hypothetical protein